METIDIVELFEKCINGRGGCVACPHKEGHKGEDGSTCIARLGKDVINHVNALKAQIEYYEEVIEEYETAEFERQELADKLADVPLWTHDGSSSWTMELGDCTTATGVYAHAEGATTTASGAYTPVEVGFTRSSGYDLGRLDAVSSSSKWELEPILEKATEAVEAELKKKDKKPRWFEKWTEKT